MRIGVLALQGAFAKHAAVLTALGAQPIFVRTAADLAGCAGLILPGGESTAMRFLLQTRGLLPALALFSQSHPLFGTCAGMILLAQGGPLPLFDISVTRNAYGRQAASFHCTLPLSLPLRGEIEAFFIRAPQITAILSPQVHTLALWEGVPVCIQQGIHIAAAFHPELGPSPHLHAYFLHLATQNSLALLQR